MNKTVTVNIGGIIFHIDENAYEKLNRYLESIRSYFKTSDGGEEIVHDIESRIAEMFSERIKDSKQVIVMLDVDHVMNVMGKPEEFVNEGASLEEETEKIYVKKRLFRDPDDKVLGGVCAGISKYLGIDPIWLRLAFVVLTLLGVGSFIIIYIILWVIMPKATTITEKLQMRGEPVNITNIQKSAKEELEGIRKKFGDITDDTKEWGRNAGPYVQSGGQKVANLLGDILKFLLKAILKLIAVFFILIGLIVIAAVLIGLFAGIGALGIAFPILAASFFASELQQILSYLAVILVIGIPFLALIYIGIKVLFNIPYKNKIFGSVALGLWFVGIIIASVLAAQISSNFSYREAVRENIVFDYVTSDTLYLNLNKRTDVGKNNISFGDENTFGITEDDRIFLPNVEMDIKPSNTNQFELEQTISARGKTQREALANARNVKYNLTLQDSMLFFDNGFLLDRNEKFRAQKVKLILKVPVGKTIYLAHGMEDIIYDIDNVTSTYDRHMIGHKWQMLPEGLTCLDCNFGTVKQNRTGSGRARVKIRPGSVYVDDDEVEININSRGIDIREKGKTGDSVQ
jgi:phage shock protein PspC (stress-responsive transcriptional regulator)